MEDAADVVLLAGADEDFTWDTLDRAFRMLLDGAALVAMHRNLSWMTDRAQAAQATAPCAKAENFSPPASR